MGAEKQPAEETKHQAEGRPDDAEPQAEAGAERYPPTKKDDSIEAPAETGAAAGESRSFEGSVESADGETRSSEPDPSVNQGHMGPAADPVEGKR